MTAHQGALSPGMPWCRPPGGSRPCCTWNGCRRGTEICKANHGKLENFGTSKIFSFFWWTPVETTLKKSLSGGGKPVESKPARHAHQNKQAEIVPGWVRGGTAKRMVFWMIVRKKTAKFMVRSHISIHKWD